MTGKDPKFTDPAKGDFGVGADSPAREAGSLEARPAGMAHDLARTVVPIEAQADIGSYEFSPYPWMVPTRVPGASLMGQAGRCR